MRLLLLGVVILGTLAGSGDPVTPEQYGGLEAGVLEFVTPEQLAADVAAWLTGNVSS